jgi:integrase-like protein
MSYFSGSSGWSVAHGRQEPATGRASAQHEAVSAVQAPDVRLARVRPAAGWDDDLADAQTGFHKRTRPYRPQTNGKVERLSRTLLTEWAYPQLFASSRERTQALPGWLHTYNHHRGHTALSGLPPLSRIAVNELAGHYT